MASDVIGSAVISVGADSDEFDQDMSQAGSSGGGKFKAALKASLKAGLVGAGVAAGAALMGGFKSAIDQQNAKRVLSGLYGSAKQATKTMQGLEKVARGSSLDYSNYLKAGESLAYAGVKGKQATGILKNVGKAISASGGSSENLDAAGDAILNMVNAGKVNLEMLQQLSNTGVPILSGLAKHFGTSIAQVNKMASNGKIKLDDVLSVMQKGTGDTFQKMIKAGDKVDKSFGNTMKRLKDSVSVQIGKMMVPVLDSLTPVLAKAGDALTGFLKGMRTGKGAGGAFVNVLRTLAGALKSTYQWFTKHEEIATALGIAIGVMTTALIAYNVYQKIVANWTNIMAAAQRAWSLAMNASLIGIITLAIAALVLALIHAYKHSAKFRAIVQAVWKAVKAVIASVVDWFVNTAWPNIKKALTWIGDKATWLWQNVMVPAFHGIAKVVSWAWSHVIHPTLKLLWAFITKWVVPVVRLLWRVVKTVFTLIGKFISTTWHHVVKPVLKALWSFIKNVLAPIVRWLWNKVVKPAFHGIGKAIKFAWDHVIHPVFKAISRVINKGIGPTMRWLWHKVVKPVWHGIRGTIDAAWKNVIKPTFSAIKSGVHGVKKAFDAAKDGISKVWNKIRAIVRKPVAFAVNKVIRPFLGGVNNVLGFLHIGKVPRPAKMSVGGPVRGSSPSPTADNIPAMLTADEEVIRQRSARRMRRSYPGYMEHINAYGRPPGYAYGGRVASSGIEKYRPGMRPALVSAMRALQKRGWSILELMPFDYVDPVHSKNSLHYLPSRGAGNAADISRPGMKGADAVAQQLMAAGFGVKWKVPGHYNHIHVDTSMLNHVNGRWFGVGKGGGGGFLGGAFKWVGKLKDLAKDILGAPGRIASKFGASKWAKIPGGVLKHVGKSVFSWAKDKVTSLLNPLNWFEGDATGHGKLGGDLVTKLKVKSVMAKYGWDKGRQWNALARLVQNESGWNPHARNPSSGAYGLFQSLPASKILRYGPLNSIEAQAKFGRNYIRGRYGTPVNALRRWLARSPHWYSQGGRVDAGSLGGLPVGSYDSGGWLPKGLSLAYNGTGREEPVGHDLSRGRDGVTYRITSINHSNNVTADGVAQQILFQARRAGGKYGLVA